MPEHRGDDLTVAFAHMARDLLAQESLQATLDRICEHAVALVDGCESAGIMVLHRKGRAETVAATDDLVRVSDQTQAELGEGPCLDATARSIQVYRIARHGRCGTAVATLRAPARALGVGSMMGLLLYTDEDEPRRSSTPRSAPARTSARHWASSWNATRSPKTRPSPCSAAPPSTATPSSASSPATSSPR